MGEKKQCQKNKILFNYRIKEGLRFSFRNILASLILLLALFFNASNTYAQSMGISGIAIIPDPSSILEMRTTTKGMLIPRMTEAERDLISSPANGLMAYNTSTNQFNFYDGINWIALMSNSNSDLTGEVTSVGNATTLGSFTSTSLSTALTDETGTVLAVFSDSPEFTGTPIAPTAAEGTNTTQLATTAFVLENTDGYSSIDAGTIATTTSTTDVLLGGMTLTPGEGTYIVNFNAQCDLPDAVSTSGFSTATAAADLNLIYTDIINIPVTNTTHSLTFGSGELLTPGVYSIVGAISIAGSLTLDGVGDPNSIFIIKGSAALNTAAGTVVTLINGASPENIYWIAQDAIGLGASTTIQGTVFSNSAAIAVGATCTVNGRLLTKAGALSFGAGILTLPTNPSSINFRSLTSFVMFTSAGGIANAGASTYTGDIGTNLGAITAFTAIGCIVNGTIFQAGSTTVVVSVNHEATFSLYANGVLIPNSGRTRTSLSAPSDIYLLGVATIMAGQNIEVRWKVDGQVSDLGGQVNADNRVLSLTMVR
ncbi:MAG: hypothetical protein ACJASQ_002307 [Crocinitomicaceae bacterium]|jgi:hypothetical protein